MATSREAAAVVPILERFGVPRDGVLVVHSAIAPLSRRGLRAEAIIEALIDYMRDGNLFMPTMTWRTVAPEPPAGAAFTPRIRWQGSDRRHRSCCRAITSTIRRSPPTAPTG